ncbi:MAG: tetratricopeptide repeat protein [Bacteroidota bacterium]
MDTTDYNSLYAYAIFLKITGNFDQAQVNLEKIQKSSAATDWQIAQANDLSGQIYQETKSLDRAAQVYQQYLAMLQRLIRLNPEDRFYKHCLADLYYRLGYTYKEQAYLESNSMIDTRVYIDTALIFFKKRAQVWEALFRIDPEYEVRNSSLFIAYETVSNLYFLYSDMDSSIQYYLKNAEMLEMLHRKHPDNMLLADNLVNVYSCLAAEYSEQQRAEKVIEYNRKLVNIDVIINRILEKVDSAKVNYVQRSENMETIRSYYNNRYRQESFRGSFYEAIARTYKDVNQLDSAAFYYTKKINLYKNRISNDSLFNEYASSLANAYSDLGNVYKIQGKLDTALECAFEELRIYKKVLPQSLKGSRLDKSGLARCYGKIGDLYQMQGKLDSALNYFSRAAQTTVELLYEYPQGSNKSILAESYAKTGAIYALWDQKEKAIQYDEKAIELYKQLFVAFAWEKYKEHYEDLEREVNRLKSN